MANNDWKNRLGMVYSTNPNFKYDYDVEEEETVETLPLDKQKLIVRLDKKGRAGKQMTAVEGFIGADEDLQVLAKFLKTKCGVGGTAKEGMILIQGDLRDKITEILNKEGYRVKRGN